MSNTRIQLSDDEFKAVDPLSIGRLNPYGPDDPNVFNMFKLGSQFYRSYVNDKAQFTGGRRVLDLLSGFGMWSLFLAEENDQVIGIDSIPDCQKYGRRLAEYFGFKNIELLCGDVSRISEFQQGWFDFVWMYSALQYVNRGQVLAEVSRVLAPKGRLFVGNYNSTGLMIDHFMNGVRSNEINSGASQWALDALVDGPLGDGNPNYGTVSTIAEVCRKYGLRLCAVSPQGGLDLRQPNGVLPTFKGAKLYEIHDVTIDFVAEKTT